MYHKTEIEIRKAINKIVKKVGVVEGQDWDKELEKELFSSATYSPKEKKTLSIKIELGNEKGLLLVKDARTFIKAMIEHLDFNNDYFSPEFCKIVNKRLHTCLKNIRYWVPDKNEEKNE